MRFVVSRWPWRAALALCLLSGCSDDEADAQGGAPDVEVSDASVDAQLGDAAEPLERLDAEVEAAPDAGGPIWTRLSWRPMRASGDPAGDPQADDALGAADIVQMSYAIADEALHFDLEFAAPFPAERGALEIFIISPDDPQTGHTLRLNAGALTFWEADCSSASGKHRGCHWGKLDPPASLSSAWPSEARFYCQIPRSALGCDDLTEIRMGVAAAPFEIEVTAEFTDRYPDDLWVTSQEVEGLASVPLTSP